MSLSFAVMSDEIGRKLYLMMQEAFAGSPPVSISAEYETAVIFAQSKEGDLRLDPTVLCRDRLRGQGARFADPASGPTSRPTTGRSSTCRSGCIRARICGGRAWSSGFRSCSTPGS